MSEHGWALFCGKCGEQLRVVEFDAKTQLLIGDITESEAMDYGVEDVRYEAWQCPDCDTHVVLAETGGEP